VDSEPAQLLASDEIVGGRYRVERLLGRGGMGVVYEVRDGAGGHPLALKRLHTGSHTTHAALFEREYRTLASLRHPRIVQVYEYGVDARGPYYTMELLEGRDLANAAPMPWREVCACLRDVASVLGVLHARRLVHRDLSPRNLWQTHDGRLRLLDFGALASFGVAKETVGTPAFIAPESLASKPLDARTDLFALGALGYWLLTSTPAFRASTLGELPRVWQKPPASPSSLAKLVPGAATDIPARLEQLVLSLLRIDPDERPRSTADVVDELNAIASLRPEPDELIEQGYLESSAFAGRAHERERFAHALHRASRARPQALSVEGYEGIGRTRLLGEFATAARIAGATVLMAGASDANRPYQTAHALARELLKSLPRPASEAARTWSLDTDSLVDGAPQRSRVDALEERARRQLALERWFLALARAHTLVLLVDDLQAVDAESRALLATLARAAAGHRLLVVAALRSDAPDQQLHGTHEFCNTARKLVLLPLSQPELRELLRSVFGEVPYLERLSARLHRITDGSPGHALMLARHLVRSGAAHYAAGAWTLPADLPDDLPSTLRASVIAALANLPIEARTLARHASLPDHGPLTRPMLAELARVDRVSADGTIALLLEQRLLRQSEDGLMLAHAALAEVMRNELTPAERTRARRVIARHLASHDDLLSQLRCALHLLQAGDVRQGETRLLAASRRIMTGEHILLRACAPILAEAVEALRGLGRGDLVQLPVLNALSVAGYLVDRGYATRYGDQAIAAAQRVLHFDLARRWKPYLGGLLSLFLALAWSSLQGRLRGSRLRTLEIAGWLVTVTGYLMGPASLCLDSDRLQRLASVLEPLLALGRDHAVSCVHHFCRCLILTLEDRCAAAPEALTPLIERLQGSEPIRALPPANRKNLLASALYAYGLRETFACDEHLLVTASTLEGFSAMHAMQADQLRWLYHAHLGEMERAAVFEQRLELRAIQLGTGWQAELLMPRHRARIAIWTHDAATNGRALRALVRLTRDLPSLEVYERRARAVELVLRGNHRTALPWLEIAEEPQGRLGWASMRALLAATYRELGEAQRAREVCVDGLARLSERDRDYVIMNLPLEVELAQAEAALGAAAEAEQKLRTLSDAHRDKGPLVNGYLHRARSYVALLVGDLARAEQQLEAMDTCYRATQLPSLLMFSAELREQLRNMRQPQVIESRPLDANDAHLLTRVELMMTGSREHEDRARAALRVALELTRAECGFVLYPGQAQPAACTGVNVHDDVLRWAAARLLESEADDDATSSASDGAPSADLNARSFEGVHYCLSFLWKLEGHHDRPIAIVALGSRASVPAVPSSAVLRVLGERLSDRARAALHADG
jgi:hypothetical protein